MGGIIITHKKRLLIYSISAALLLFLAVSVYYHVPENITIDTVVYKQNSEESMPILIFVQIYKSFFKPTIARGYIIFDGNTYQDMASLGKGYDFNASKSFFENIKLKLQDFRYYYFVRSDFKGKQLKLLTDTLTLNFGADNSTFTVLKAGNNEGLYFSK
ncbi:MAG: hypothetical protein VB118_06755 [Oscillospiraceae bacterium]|nr:hypothetical protein [Oscillospiraceae bacterium]